MFLEQIHTLGHRAVQSGTMLRTDSKIDQACTLLIFDSEICLHITFISIFKTSQYNSFLDKKILANSPWKTLAKLSFRTWARILQLQFLLRCRTRRQQGKTALLAPSLLDCSLRDYLKLHLSFQVETRSRKDLELRPCAHLQPLEHCKARLTPQTKGPKTSLRVRLIIGLPLPTFFPFTLAKKMEKPAK